MVSNPRHLSALNSAGPSMPRKLLHQTFFFDIRGPVAFTTDVKRLAVDISLPVLTTVSQGQDSNPDLLHAFDQPSHCESILWFWAMSHQTKGFLHWNVTFVVNLGLCSAPTAFLMFCHYFGCTGSHPKDFHN